MNSHQVTRIKRLYSQIQLRYSHVLEVANQTLCQKAIAQEKQSDYPSLATDKPLLPHPSSMDRDTCDPSINQCPQQTTERDGADLLNRAAQTLQTFAQEHCGPASCKRTQPKRRLFGIGSRRVIAEERRWSVTIENGMSVSPSGKVKVSPYAILDLHQIPEAIIRVEVVKGVDASVHHTYRYGVELWAGTDIPGIPEPGINSTLTDNVNAQSIALNTVLNRWITQGSLQTKNHKLYYSGRHIG